MSKPSVLFVCVHNAGRSQMAAGFMRELGQGRVEVLSAGSAPKDSINPVAVAAMAEVGIDIANNTPKILTPEAVQASDAVITMGKWFIVTLWMYLMDKGAGSRRIFEMS